MRDADFVSGRVFVTGGTGFLGRAVVAALLRRGVRDVSRPDGQPRRSVDAARARELFGFRAGTDFRTGLARTIDWYRSHRVEAESRRT